jgi:transposase-like protein
MVRPGREPLAEHVEADETRIGGPRSGKRGGGAAGKTVVAGAVERGKARGRRLGRLRLQAVADASAGSLVGFLDANTNKPARLTTDRWRGYRGLGARGHRHDAINLESSPGGASRHLPAIHLVFGLAKRWLLGTHHGAVRKKHLQAHLDGYVLRFDRRTAKSIAHRFARLIQHAVLTPPATYGAIVAGRGHLKVVASQSIFGLTGIFSRFRQRS